MKTFAFCLALVALCACVLAQDRDRDADYQHEPRRPGESEFNARQDNAFDREVGNDAPRPRGRRPNRNDVRRTYNQDKDRLLRESTPEEREQIRRDMNSMTFDPQIDFQTYEEWTSTSNNLTCCPPVWDYGCESQRVPMPCFYRSYGRRSEWCCPFHPSGITIKKCKCRRCGILKPKCVKTGRCQRRYKEKNYYAICYSNNAWSKIRYYKTFLPTSCYCLARD